MQYGVHVYSAAYVCTLYNYGSGTVYTVQYIPVCHSDCSIIKSASECELALNLTKLFEGATVKHKIKSG